MKGPTMKTPRSEALATFRTFRTLPVLHEVVQPLIGFPLPWTANMARETLRQ